MSRFRRLEVLNKISSVGLVPVFYEPDLAVAKKIITACAEGGATVVEMTNRGDHAPALFRDLEHYCREKHPGLVFGVGSIVDAPTAALYISLGAAFVVGPCLDRETALVCNKRKVAYIPGCGTATEIHEAEALGVEICKIFPGDLVGGPDFVKAVRGPCPWTSIMPTGGVDPTPESLAAWFEAGITAAGIGSKLITRDFLKAGDFAGIAAKVKYTIALIDEIRKKHRK
jgi:2-dehydro-3-deoxyphosphogluconate aldolase/(4S)-4-hydroxy-2-oxoglutarate aldolase